MKHAVVSLSGAGGSQIVYLSFQLISAAAYAGQGCYYLGVVVIHIVRYNKPNIYAICIVSNGVGPITGELDDADLDGLRRCLPRFQRRCL